MQNRRTKIDVNDRLARINVSVADDDNKRARIKRRANDIPTLAKQVEEKLAQEHQEVYQTARYDEDAVHEFEKALDKVLAEFQPPLSRFDQVKIRKHLLAKSTGLGKLDPLMTDMEITEIMVNGNKGIFVERGGKLEKVDPSYISLTKEEIEEIGRRLKDRSNTRWTDEEPIVKFRLRDGSRITMVREPAAIYGPYINIRRFLTESRSMKYLVENRTLSQEWADFLGECVQAGLNILVAGGTGTGKSTFLDALLSDNLPKAQRVLVIEESHELHVQDYHPNTVVLQGAADGEENEGQTMRDCLKAALVMRPDRIILGEAKGSEIVEVIQAMISGHKGSITTAHTKDSKWGALKRMATMLRQGQPGVSWEVLEEQIRDALDLIVYMERDEFTGERKVKEITEVVPAYVSENPFHELAMYDENSEEFGTVGELTKIRQKALERFRLKKGRYGGGKK